MSLAPINQAPMIRPVRPVVKQAPAPAPAPGPKPQARPAPKPGLFHRFVTWLLGPYLRYAADQGEARFMHPGHQADSHTPADVGLKAEKLSFKSGDGTPLSGWYMPAAKPTGKTIVLAHGHGGNMGDMISEYARFLHDAGYNVLAFDFRNSGSSGGDHTTLGYEERGDLEAALDLAAARGGTSLGVLGASTALEEASADPRVKTVVADCPFDTLTNAIVPRVKAATTSVGPLKDVHYPFPGLASEAILDRVIARSGEPLPDVDPIKLMGKLGSRPVLLIHGAADDETPADCSRRLFDADPGKDKQLVLVPGARHAQSHKTDPKGYEQRVLAWLGRTL